MTSSATAPPTVSQRNRGCRTFGAIQNSSASSTIAISSSTGHFATPTRSARQSPRSSASPTASVTGPLTISTQRDDRQQHQGDRGQQPICSGRSFQIGRPSSTP